MKNKLKRAIHTEEYVPINGIDQYLFQAGTRVDNPVMLYLHGGPGSAESIFAHAFQEKWEEVFTVVHWDQRGSGKTLTKNPHAYPTFELLLQDLFEVVQYLKKKYNKDKVVILGHSWGSVLGSIFVKQHPEDVDYYIGTGQVVNKLESERVSYAKVKEAIIKANDQKSLKELEALGEYPGDKLDSEWLGKSIKMKQLKGKYNLADKVGFATLKIIFTSPIFKFSDISALSNGYKASKYLVDYLGSFDLTAKPANYAVPIFYIEGENDWQAPFSIVQKYFDKIEAPYKKLYSIPGAGHMAMLDRPDLFFNILQEIVTTDLGR